MFSAKYTVEERKILEDNIRSFKDQVGAMNSGITTRLDDLEDRIREYREKCQRDREMEAFRSKIREEEELRYQQMKQ